MEVNSWVVEKESNKRIDYKISRRYKDVEIKGEGVVMTRGRLGTSI